MKPTTQADTESGHPFIEVATNPMSAARAGSVVVTSDLFEAFLKCQTKAFLQFVGQPGIHSDIHSWQTAEHEIYFEGCRSLLRSSAGARDRISEETLVAQPLEGLGCNLFLKCSFATSGYRSNIDAVIREVVRKAGASCFVPVRCIPRHRVTKADRLLIAFDALLLSELNGKPPLWGKIIHGPQKRVMRVKLGILLTDVRSLVKPLAEQLSQKASPPLVLNKHCSECAYRALCRERAVASDDLSLLASIHEKELKKFHGKGIFSIKQLSYTFRPRRRKKAAPDAQEKYHHSLKALAIREQKVHIVGNPVINITSTAVFLDVEGVPDQEFYYLIGVRIGTGQSRVQHSFWANTQSEEESIWRAFLAVLHDLPNPQIIHYGSYETQFLKKMSRRYYSKDVADFVEGLISRSLNLLSVIYARIYFPTYTNGLKEIAQYIGFQWSSSIRTGADVLAARHRWETNDDPELKSKMATYNNEDCEALEVTCNYVVHLCRRAAEGHTDPDLVNTNNLKREGYFGKFKKADFLLPEFEKINRASYWNYQRERIFFRSGKNAGRRRLNVRAIASKRLPINKVVECKRRPTRCPKCGARKIYKHDSWEKIVYDLKFGRAGVRRWIVKYLFHRYLCWSCKTAFTPGHRPWTRSKFGADLMRYAVYQIIELQVSQMAVTRNINELFRLDLPRTAISKLKTSAALYYKDTYEGIIKRIINGPLVHVDETKINIDGRDSYVWVLTNQEEVAYFYTETREGVKIQELLKSFKGVLVSDFYGVYDSIDCRQQKCLIHLIRDLNDALSQEPFNAEIKELSQKFAEMLRPIIDTVDKWGLKTKHLRKHKVPVVRFFRWIDEFPFRNETTLKFKKRFNKNREKLFTFLDHDQVPWNNNNAEHAIKSLARLRRVLSGKSSVNGIHEYLILLSVCETCKYKEVNFLRFLRSGSMDIDNFRAGMQIGMSPNPEIFA